MLRPSIGRGFPCARLPYFTNAGTHASLSTAHDANAMTTPETAVNVAPATPPAARPISSIETAFWASGAGAPVSPHATPVGGLGLAQPDEGRLPLPIADCYGCLTWMRPDVRARRDDYGGLPRWRFLATVSRNNRKMPAGSE